MQRIEKMRKVNEYVERLKKATRAHFREQVDEDAYKQLMQDLLVQVRKIYDISFNLLLMDIGPGKAYGRVSLHQMQRIGQRDH